MWSIFFTLIRTTHFYTEMVVFVKEVWPCQTTCLFTGFPYFEFASLSKSVKLIFHKCVIQHRMDLNSRNIYLHFILRVQELALSITEKQVYLLYTTYGYLLYRMFWYQIINRRFLLSSHYASWWNNRKTIPEKMRIYSRMVLSCISTIRWKLFRKRVKCLVILQEEFVLFPGKFLWMM